MCMIIRSTRNCFRASALYVNTCYHMPGTWYFVTGSGLKPQYVEGIRANTFLGSCENVPGSTHPFSRTSQSPEVQVFPQMIPCGCCMALIEPTPLFSKLLP